MNIRPDGFFTEFELTDKEEIAALNNPYLLAYLQTKRAAYATAVIQTQISKGTTGTVDPLTSTIELEQQRAKLSLLTELIDEVIQAQSIAAEDEVQD